MDERQTEGGDEVDLLVMSRVFERDIAITVLPSPFHEFHHHSEQ